MLSSIYMIIKTIRIDSKLARRGQLNVVYPTLEPNRPITANPPNSKSLGDLDLLVLQSVSFTLGNYFKKYLYIVYSKESPPTITKYIQYFFTGCHPWLLEVFAITPISKSPIEDNRLNNNSEFIIFNLNL